MQQVNRLWEWIADIYSKNGWQAGLIAFVTIVSLIAAIAYFFGLPLLQLLGLQ
jgi:hypothetical protein